MPLSLKLMRAFNNPPTNRKIIVCYIILYIAIIPVNDVSFLHLGADMQSILFLLFILNAALANASPCSNVPDSDLIPGHIEYNESCSSQISSSGRCVLDIELAEDKEQGKSGLEIFLEIVGTDSDICGQELQYSGSKKIPSKIMIRFMGWPSFTEN